MSSEDPRLLFSVGESEEVIVEVAWPGRESERWMALLTGRYHSLVEGTASRTEDTSGL